MKRFELRRVIIAGPDPVRVERATAELCPGGRLAEKARGLEIFTTSDPFAGRAQRDDTLTILVMPYGDDDTFMEVRADYECFSFQDHEEFLLDAEMALLIGREWRDKRREELEAEGLTEARDEEKGKRDD